MVTFGCAESYTQLRKTRSKIVRVRWRTCGDDCPGRKKETVTPGWYTVEAALRFPVLQEALRLGGSGVVYSASIDRDGKAPTTVGRHRETNTHTHTHTHTDTICVWSMISLFPSSLTDDHRLFGDREWTCVCTMSRERSCLRTVDEDDDASGGVRVRRSLLDQIVPDEQTTHDAAACLCFFLLLRCLLGRVYSSAEWVILAWKDRFMSVLMRDERKKRVQGE